MTFVPRCDDKDCEGYGMPLVYNPDEQGKTCISCIPKPCKECRAQKGPSPSEAECQGCTKWKRGYTVKIGEYVGGGQGIPRMKVIRKSTDDPGFGNVIVLVEDFGSHKPPGKNRREWEFMSRVLKLDGKDGRWTYRKDFATLNGASKHFDRLIDEEGRTEEM